MGEPKFTPGPWVATHFTKHDGTEIKTVDDVAETTSASARWSDIAELHGVTLAGDEEGTVVCYTGNGPRSHINAHLIAAAPALFEACGDEAATNAAFSLLDAIRRGHEFTPEELAECGNRLGEERAKRRAALAQALGESR